MNVPRKRARELGLSPGILPVGTWNSITDVQGVKVGHVTLIEGDDIRTGVTTILPHNGNVFQEKVPSALVVGNGFGKLTGSTQVEELGELETPIVLTNTLSVPRAAEAVIEWTLAQQGNEDVRSVNPVVGETNDGILNNIRKMAITKEDVIEAIENASSGLVGRGVSVQARERFASDGRVVLVRVHVFSLQSSVDTSLVRCCSRILAAFYRWMGFPLGNNLDNIISKNNLRMHLPMAQS